MDKKTRENLVKIEDKVLELWKGNFFSFLERVVRVEENIDKPIMEIKKDPETEEALSQTREQTEKIIRAKVDEIKADPSKYNILDFMKELREGLKGRIPDDLIELRMAGIIGIFMEHTEETMEIDQKIDETLEEYEKILEEEKIERRFSPREIKQKVDKTLKEVRKRWKEAEVRAKRAERRAKKLEEALKKKEVPLLPVVKIDRATSEEILPLFLTRGIFSRFDKIPDIQDLAIKEESRIKRKLTAKEIETLEIETREYKKNGFVWREFPDYAIGFGYKHYREYLEEQEEKYKKRQLEAITTKPFLFPGMKKEIDEVLEQIRLYKEGQELAYGILGEIYLQRRLNGVKLSKENAVYYIGQSPNAKKAYNRVKQILNSSRWLSYRIIGRGNSKIKEGVGNFIYNILERPKDYILDINPVYAGCVMHFFGDGELRSKKEKKELFSRGYFSFPFKALAVSGKYSVHAQEFRNYILREKGNRHLNTNQHKVISQKVKVYIQKSVLRLSRRNENYAAFIDDVLPTLIRDKFIDKTHPPLDELKTLPSKTAYETKLILYIPKIEKLDKGLEQLLKQKGVS